MSEVAMWRRGFTLIEMMVVVAVVGVGGALAAYNMADHVRDARTRAEVNELVQSLRSEHRRAREQLHHLKVEGGARQVTYTPMRDADCAVAVGTPRVEKYRYASLAILNVTDGAACFNPAGIVINATTTGGGVVGPPELNTGPSEGEGEDKDTETPGLPIFLIEATLADETRSLLQPVRAEPSGLNASTRSAVLSAPEATLFKQKLRTAPEPTLAELEGPPLPLGAPAPASPPFAGPPIQAPPIGAP
jgi:prepilin-type N-terminal cleavage/methylation domain-containing protein